MGMKFLGLILSLVQNDGKLEKNLRTFKTDQGCVSGFCEIFKGWKIFSRLDMW